MRYRDAEPGDAERIARLHADSWRRHYRGAFPDRYLDGDIHGERLAAWTERLTPPVANQSTTVAERDGELVGFVHTIFDEDATWGALLDNLHVTYELKGQGVGSRLMAEAARAVLERPRSTPGLHLWVLEQNAAARAFYTARGGTEVERVADDPVPGGGTVPSFRVAWPDPSILRIVPRVITPETKNWTWVLDRECPDCGFDASRCAARDVAALVRANAEDWRRLFAAGAITSVRPNAVTWSGLEYACHVRDVYRRFDARIALMLAEDDATFENWDQDASAVEERYEEQAPAVVVAELEAAADQMAARLDAISGDQWPRPGYRSDGSQFTVDTISRYMVHDTIHHIWDVQENA